MKIEIVKTWSGRPPGYVFESMHPGMANTLIDRGFAKSLESPKKSDDDKLQPKSNNGTVKRTRKPNRSKGSS